LVKAASSHEQLFAPFHSRIIPHGLAGLTGSLSLEEFKRLPRVKVFRTSIA
jgi:hypothetical protein